MILRKVIHMIVSLQHARLKSSSVIFESETEAIGVIGKGEESKIYLPSMLIRMFEIHNYVNNLKPFQDFPIFSLEFVYKNIYGKLLKSTFKVGLLTVEDKTNYSVYTIINQQLNN